MSILKLNKLILNPKIIKNINHRINKYKIRHAAIEKLMNIK